DSRSESLECVSRRTGSCLFCLRHALVVSHTRSGSIPGRPFFRHLSTPSCNGCVGGPARNGDQPSARGPAGWRTHRIRTLRQNGSRDFLLGCHSEPCRGGPVLLAMVGLGGCDVFLSPASVDLRCSAARNPAAAHRTHCTFFIRSVVFSHPRPSWMINAEL